MQVNCDLYIKVGHNDNGSYLQDSYCRQPFKIADITEGAGRAILKLMIMSSSPGFLDNDDFTTEVEVAENAIVEITTQGYQRLFTMKGVARQNIHVNLRNNASICFLPHPTVPHAGSSYSAVNTISLSQKHNLIWCEIITCGRKLSGEEFSFTRFHSITEVYVTNKLVVKENILLQPLQINIRSIGLMEGYTHQSSLLFINDRAGMKNIMEPCIELLSPDEEISFGISMLPVNGLVVRILGTKAEKLFNYNKALASLIRQLLHVNSPADAEIFSA
jgi:urease accessory protein